MADLPSRRALLIATTWWSGPAKLAISLARHGWELEAICPADHPFLFVSCLSRIYSYRALRPKPSLLVAILTSRPSLLIPCDDGAVWQLHELYKSRPELRGLIAQSLGDAAAYPLLASRAKVNRMAESLGIRCPETMAIADENDLRCWFEGRHRSGVLKRDGTFGGKGVRLVHSPAEATRALTDLSRRKSFVGATLRWLAVHDPLSFHGIGSAAPVVMQELIHGQPANISFVCHEGRVLASVTVEVLATEGATGAALGVGVIEHPEIRQAAEKIADRLQLSGFHGLDFMLAAGTGEAYLIEMNPRCTQLGHLAICGQGELAAYLGRSSLPPGTEISGAISQQTILFFPQSLWSLRNALETEHVYVDAPWAEPRLLRELVKCDWRERHWLGRIYYRFRPNKRAAVFWQSAAQPEEQARQGMETDGLRAPLADTAVRAST